MTNDANKQLTISFDHDKLVSAYFSAGNFLHLVELSLPEEKAHWDRAREVIRDFSSNPPDGLAFVVRRSSRTPIQQLAELKKSTQFPFILTLSGTGATLRDIREDAAAAASIGIRNLLAVTGNLPPHYNPGEEDAAQTVPGGCTDSLDSLAALNVPGKPQLLAAAVNPHAYQPEAVVLHYAKMLAKLKNGASWLVAQAGWDMRKYQELQWMLQMQEKMVPVVPRIRLFSPQEAARLNNTPEPGVCIPVPIGAKLARLAENTDAFNEYQRRLAALMAVGFRKIGYAGILLAGSADAALLRGILEEIDSLDAKTTSYDSWLSQWSDFIGDISLDPPPSPNAAGQAFYLFSNLLQRELPFFTRGISKFTRMPMEKPPRWQEFRNRLLAPNAPGLLNAVARKIFRTTPTLDNAYGLDNASCPKRLLKGPCGNVRPDGFCEAGHAPCFFKQVARIAVPKGDIAIFDGIE